MATKKVKDLPAGKKSTGVKGGKHQEDLDK